jgi:hypothetical protein
MQQLRLVPHHTLSDKTISFEQIKASFRTVSESVQEVLLEINSHKFLIHIKTGLQKLEKFEIVAVKGLIEVGMKVVRLLKKLVSVLYFEY